MRRAVTVAMAMGLLFILVGCAHTTLRDPEANLRESYIIDLCISKAIVIAKK